MSTAPAASIPQRRTRAAVPWPEFLKGAEGITGLVILLGVVAVALVGPAVAPHGIATPVGVPGAGPSDAAPLGTDFLGRDVLSRVLHGGWPVLRLSVLTTALTYVIGVSVGMAAGYLRSAADTLLMRSVDVLLSFPPLLLLLLLIAGSGTSQAVLIIGLVIILFPGVARIVRTATLEVCTTGYVEAAQSRGERAPNIMLREILPNISPVILADMGVRFAAAVVIAASVNFLGLGAKPPAADWGLMVAENRPVISANLWAVLVPAALLALLAISVNLLADAYVRAHGGRRR